MTRSWRSRRRDKGLYKQINQLTHWHLHPSVVDGDSRRRGVVTTHVTAGVVEVTFLETTTAAADEARDADDGDDDAARRDGDGRDHAQPQYALRQRILNCNTRRGQLNNFVCVTALTQYNSSYFFTPIKYIVHGSKNKNSSTLGLNQLWSEILKQIYCFAACDLTQKIDHQCVIQANRRWSKQDKNVAPKSVLIFLQLTICFVFSLSLKEGRQSAAANSINIFIEFK